MCACVCVMQCVQSPKRDKHYLFSACLRHSGTMYPRHANMATRPCFNSTYRRRRKDAASPPLVKPDGSRQ